MAESAYQHLLKGWNPKATPTATATRRLDSAEAKAIGSWSGLGHKYINPVLRGGTAPPPFEGRQVAPLVRAIDSAVSSSTINQGGRVYRGLRMHDTEFRHMLQRKRLADPGYMSASTNPNVAYSFATKNRDVLSPDARRKVVFVMDVMPGQRALPLGKLSGENEAEILFARGSEIDIRDVVIGRDGVAVVYGRLRQVAR